MRNRVGGSSCRLQLKAGRILKYGNKTAHDYVEIMNRQELLLESLKMSTSDLRFPCDASPEFTTMGLHILFRNRVLGPREGVENNPQLHFGEPQAIMDSGTYGPLKPLWHEGHRQKRQFSFPTCRARRAAIRNG